MNYLSSFSHVTWPETSFFLSFFQLMSMYKQAYVGPYEDMTCDPESNVGDRSKHWNMIGSVHPPHSKKTLTQIPLDTVFSNQNIEWC